MNPTIAPPSTNPPPDLEARVASRKRALFAEIIEYKQSSSRASSLEAIDRARTRLLELAHILKLGAVDGWANISPSVTAKLDEWTKK